MQNFAPEHLSALIDARDDVVLSAYVPTVRAGDTDENRVRFRNLVRDARVSLEDAGLGKRDAARITDGLERELGGDHAAEHQAEGLAVFASPETCRLLRCRSQFAPLLAVGRDHYVLPLLPLAEEARRYWILAISRGRARVIETFRDRGEEYDLAGTGIPQALTDVVGSELEGQSLQFQSKQRDGHAIFHAQGRGHDDELPELEQYCRAVQRAVADELGADAPIVLAGDVRLTSLFRHVGGLRLLDETIEGTHDETPPDALAALGWPIAARTMEDEEVELKSRYDRGVGTNRASDSDEVIVPAAAAGRIDTLLLDVAVVSEASPEQNGRGLRGGRPPGAAAQTANRAALDTLRHGGKARVMTMVEMPASAPMVALLRY